MIGCDDKPNQSRSRHTHEWLWSMINSRAHYLLDQYEEIDLYSLLRSWDSCDCSDVGLVGILFDYMINLSESEAEKEYMIDTMKQYIAKHENNLRSS